MMNEPDRMTKEEISVIATARAQHPLYIFPRLHTPLDYSCACRSYLIMLTTRARRITQQ
ncbi:hypothetical protein BHM03_00047425 [Ensete ventricosum]|nr:hypothetical protein BHM03_00047425 [Ensete ventricosum]